MARMLSRSSKGIMCVVLPARHQRVRNAQLVQDAGDDKIHHVIHRAGVGVKPGAGGRMVTPSRASVSMFSR